LSVAVGVGNGDVGVAVGSGDVGVGVAVEGGDVGVGVAVEGGGGTLKLALFWIAWPLISTLAV
jgi:hypothetical protein